MKKKRFLFTSALALTLLLSACGGNTKNSSSSSSIESKSDSSQSPISSSSSNKGSSSSAKSESSIQPSSQSDPASSAVSSSEAPSSSKASSVEPASSTQPASSAQSTSSASASTTSGQPASSSQAPAAYAYYALYDNQEIGLAEDNNYLADGQIAQYRATLGNIEADKEIFILDSNKQEIQNNFGAEPGLNNVKTNEYGKYLIHNDAENAFVIVKLWQENNWTNFYVSGYEEEVVPEPVYKVLGLNKDWTYEAGVEFVDATEGTEYVKQLKASFDVAYGEEFRISDGENFVDNNIFEPNSSFEQYENNIRAKATGHVDLYFKTYENHSQSVAIVFQPEYRVVGLFGNWSYENGARFIDVSEEEKVGVEYNVKLQATFHVYANDEFKLTDGNNWIGGENLTAHESFEVVESGNIKAKAAGGVTLVFTTGLNGAQTLEIAFDPDPVIEPEPTDVTYTVLDLPDWITNDNAVVFAWVWSESDPGSWKTVSFGETGEAIFTVTGEVTGFLLVRCHSETVEPDWTIAEDVAGRIYNKTDNFVAVADQHAYLSPADWNTYNPE